ncbi:MAG: hypothetical protein Q8O67_21380 [Deltaproteobacteria bacterium]|nr:hypothetical protein [Deltaproteobacteria bacterium]
MRACSAAFVVAVVVVCASTGCSSEVRCAGAGRCPAGAPFCVESVCQASPGGEEAAEGEGEGEPAEGEGEPAEGEGEGELDCGDAGCAVDLACVDEGSVDVGVCVPPADTPDGCAAANQFFAREAQAPRIWRATHVATFEPPDSSIFSCSGSERAVQFNFQFLDDEDDAGHRDSPVQVRSQNGTTTPPPDNIALVFSGRDGHVGSVTAIVCLTTNVGEFAFAFDDDDGNTSNAICIFVP